MLAHSSKTLLSKALALQSQVEGVLSRAPERIALEVVSGLHTGAKIDLADDVDTVGSSTDAKIVLRDGGIAPIHARLVARGKQVEVQAVGGEVGLPKGEVVPVGFGRRWTLPVELAIGDARLRLTGVGVSDNQATFRSSPPMLVATIALAAALALAANNLSNANTDPAEQAVATTQAEATGSPVPAGQAAPTLAAATDQLKSQLAAADLKTIQLTSANGQIVASGTVPKSQSQAWADVQSWFDRTHGGRVVLASEVAIGGVPAMPRLSMQAIWYGERPYVIATDGARYHEGAFVDGGWTVKEIGETALTLTKDGATVTLRYQ